MAEYAGLEIRIGGNTTKLTNALKASTKSAAELQRNIRQITHAMQFDPTDLKNVETRIRLTGDRMQSLQSKAQITKTAMEQLGSTMTSVLDDRGNAMSVKRIAENTENLSLKAKQADERFNNLTDTLAKVYEGWNRFSRSEGSDFLTQIGLTQADADRLMRATTSLREFEFELSEIRDRAKDPMYTGPIISDADIQRAKEFKQLDFHDMFKRGLDLDDVIEDAKQLGVVIEDSAIANVRDLQRTFKDAQAEKKAFDDALSYDQFGIDLQRINSEAESLSQTMRKLDDGLTPTVRTDEFQGVEAHIRSLDAALDGVEGDLRRTNEAMSMDSSNVGAAVQHFNSLQQKVDLSEQKVALLNREMALLDENGASSAVRTHQDLAKWIEESADSARKAQKEYSESSAAVANLENQTKTLKQTIDTIKGDSTAAEYSDAVIEWKKQTERLSDAMRQLKKEEDNVADTQKKLGEAQANFDEAAAQADDYKTRLDALKQEYEQLTTAMEQSGDFDMAGLSRVQELSNEIEQLESKYKGAQVNVEHFNSELSDSSERAKLAKDSFEQQSSAVDDLQKKVNKLAETREVRLFQNPGDEIEKEEAALVELQGELAQARIEEGKRKAAYDSSVAENNLAKEAKAYSEVAQQAEIAKAEAAEAREAMKVDGGSILNASTVKSVGMTLSATITPAIVGVSHSMIDASSTVDSAYRDMRKTVDGTEAQFEHLRDAAIEFSRTHVTSADQILQIEAIGGELGIATESLETFAEVISNLDVATNLDTEGAATALGHLANIMHLSEEDYVGFSDALVRLGNNGASTETEIANIAERIGSMASIVGMSASDTLAFASSIASTGQNAEAAGTAISKTMSFMETAVSAAAGTMDTSFEAIDAAVKEGGDKLTVFASLSGKTVDEFVAEWDAAPKDMAATIHDQVEAAKGDLQMIADVAHMSATEFAQTWESDPTQALKAFIEGLNDIEGAGGSADKVLVDLGITSVRQKQAIEGLMQTVDGLDDNLQMSQDAWNGVSDQWGQAGDAANEAAKKAEGFSGQIQILKNMWQNFLSELGEGAAPIIGAIADGIEGLSRAFSGLSQSTKTTIVAVGGIIAAIGPLLSMSASLVTAGGEVKKWYTDMTSGMNLVRLAAAHGSGDITAAALGTISSMEKVKLVALDLGATMLKGFAVVGVIAAIALLATALKGLYDDYQDHIAATEGLQQALSGVGESFEVAASDVDNAGVALAQLAADSSEYESRLADLTRTIEDSNRQYGTFAGQMDYYASTIETLGGKANLSQEEAYKLESALQAVNDACGTNYLLDEYGNIIDTTTGKIQENTDVILANVEARRAQALMEYYGDDYAKAVGEMTDAQDKLNKAQDEYYKLNGEFNQAMTEAGDNEAARAKAMLEYKEKVGAAQVAMDNYRQEVASTSEVVSTLEGKMATAQQQMDSANKVVKDAELAQEAYSARTETVAADVTGNMKKLSDAVESIGVDDAGFNAIAAGLDAVHAGADELNDVDMSALASAFDSANGSMADVISTLEDGGVVMSTWTSALEQAPGAAENMGVLTAAAFQAMYDSAGQNINDTMTLIAGLDMVQVGDKTFYVGDNGSIVDAQGLVYDINADIATIPEEVITTYYGDNKEALKAAMDTKSKLSSVDNQKANPTIGVTDNASKPADSVRDKLFSIDKFKANPSAYLNDYASATIGAISRSLTNLNGRGATVTITTVEKKVKQATGGLNNRPVIPRHATGYIATGPTLTNQGWIGEDGIEAVANWATGGAVVPLTNKRYMLPIADAIADGMSRRMPVADSRPNVSITVTGVAGPDETADAIERKLRLLGF